MWPQLLISLLLVQFTPPVLGDTELWIHFLSFDTKGKDKANAKCDPIGKCDPEIVFCLDHYGSQDTGINVNSCPLGYFPGNGHYHNIDKIYFNNDILGISNPLHIAVPIYPGGFVLKMDIQDDDFAVDDDDIDQIFQAVTHQRSMNSAQATSMIYTLYGERNSNPTELVVSVKVYCTTNYYGLGCDVYCIAQDDTQGHYTCDTQTGDKVCNPGWTGSSCADSVDDCVNHDCLNGATCVDGHLDYSCICAKGWAGSLCDNSTCPVCEHASPCVNGNCDCVPGYTGVRCEQDVDECLTYPCQAGYDCINSYGSYDCQLNRCYSVVCLNGGTCTGLMGYCSCAPGYTGSHII
jgi:hypothetical protein